VVQELALVLRETRLVAAVEGTPEPPVGALESFMIRTVQVLN